MCIDLGTFWIRTGRTTEGRTWLDRFLESETAEPGVTAALLHLAGSLAFVEHDLDAAERELTAALELRRDLDEPRELGMTLSNLGGLANSRGQYEQAESLFGEASEVFEAVGYGRGAAAAQLNLGLALLNMGSIESATEQLEHAVDGFRRVGDRAEEAHALLRLGFAHAELGDRIRAEARRLAAHQIYEELGRLPDLAYSHSSLAAHFFEARVFDRAQAHAAASAKLVVEEDLQRWWVSELVETAAAITAALGKPDQGARLLGCASAHRRAHDIVLPQAVKASVESTQRQIEAALGAEQFVIEVEIGGTRPLIDGVRAVASWA
jgi:tetratricopeptide (TPR) repeat protein